MIMYLIVIMIYVGRIDINAFIMSNSFLFEIRDKLFLKANTNINEWINDTIPDKNIDLLNIAIKEEISNL